MGADAPISPFHPSTSQSTTPPVFGPCNVAIYDLPHSRRRLPRYSHPDSAFLGIITSRIRGWRETRYNRARSGLRFSQGFPGVFTVIKTSSDGLICQVPGSLPGVSSLIVSSNYFTKRNLQTGIRFFHCNRDHDRDRKPFRKNRLTIFIPESIRNFRIKIGSRFSF
jgi:hypothetical protein